MDLLRDVTGMLCSEPACPASNQILLSSRRTSEPDAQLLNLYKSEQRAKGDVSSNLVPHKIAFITRRVLELSEALWQRADSGVTKSPVMPCLCPDGPRPSCAFDLGQRLEKRPYDQIPPAVCERALSPPPSDVRVREAQREYLPN
ncbi:hypothetical protein JZ751_001654 [Albula glossodonta]|uniref:Uncharacterized protein n=1 Tax=Albula glossodonta TaxID=121402 RepID=A0A8T2PUE6_9TELE|nr:hypothetical protein JZ751_001654 [Albula glossodonta]